MRTGRGTSRSSPGTVWRWSCNGYGPGGENILDSSSLVQQAPASPAATLNWTGGGTATSPSIPASRTPTIGFNRPRHVAAPAATKAGWAALRTEMAILAWQTTASTWGPASTKQPLCCAHFVVDLVLNSTCPAHSARRTGSEEKQQVSRQARDIGGGRGSTFPTLKGLNSKATAACLWVRDNGIKSFTDLKNKVKEQIDKMIEFWKGFIDIITSPVKAVVNMVKHTKETTSKSKSTAKPKKKQAFGGTITKNDTLTRLHQGEKILTKGEANRYNKGNNGNGVVINMNGVTIREEADIKKVAKSLVRELNNQKISFGGSY